MDRGQRRRPNKDEDTPMVAAAKEEVLPGYEEYLVLLQERNKLLKRLRKKNAGQIEIERKEQGFSLYVNGPHSKAGAGTSNKNSIPTQPKTSRKPKTAGDAPRNRNILDNKALEEITQRELERQHELERGKTAPNARERRRNWNKESVEIKTTQGGKKVKAPEILTGRYADDFESGDNSDELRSSDSENSDREESPPPRQHRKQRKPPLPPRESDMFNSSDSINSEDEQLHVSRHMSAILDQDSDEEDMEIDASKYNRKSNSSPRKVQKGGNKGRALQHDSDDDDDDGPSEKLMLSMRELQKLRTSLVNHATIRESLARDASSDDESFIPESPIPEVEEDLPSDDNTSLEESPGVNLNLKQPRMKPNDTIYLEFGGGPPPGKKVEKNLSAARRKDLDEGEYKSMSRPTSERHKREPVKLANRSQSAKTLVSDPPVKKSVRPLSANRRTPDSAWKDTDHDASAVMAALREENEKAANFTKEDKQTPRKRATPGGARDNLTKPLYDKSEMPPKSHQMRPRDSPRQSVGDSQVQPLVPTDKIGQIMDRVLKMTPKHQRRLVRMLGKIEQSVVTDSVDVPEDKSMTKPRKSVDGPAKPMKATRQSVTKKSRSDDNNVIDIHVEIKSNWGHAMRLGLTEIQLYDQNHTLVPIAGSDVTVHGAEECTGTVDLLFNNKFKTNKDRNMWSCRYHARRPVEITISVRNRHPESHDTFSLSQMKIWNFNKSINDLDVGVKDIRVFVGSDLVFTGQVEKGCGNQVFDYCHLIPLKPEPPTRESSPEIQKSQPEVTQSSKPSNKRTSQGNRHSVQRDQRDTSKGANTESNRKVSANNNNIQNRDNDNRRNRNNKSGERVSSQSRESRDSRESVSTPIRDTNGRPPASPRGERSPSPSPRFAANMRSPRSSRSANHRSISPSINQEHKKTIRSISMSSQSSASSGGESLPNSRPSSGLVTSSDKPNRSETRILNHGSVRNAPYSSMGSDSQSESEDYPRDGPSKGSTPAKRSGVKTPKKSKRMAARLDGHNSTDVDSSKSVSESTESRPPLPQRKSEEKLNRKSLVQKSLDEKVKKQDVEQVSKLPGKSKGRPDVTKGQDPANKQRPDSDNDFDDTLKAPGTTSSSVSVASSVSDDTPMLQKLKDMNKKDQGGVRKKEIPKWLKQEDVAGPFESPAESVDSDITPRVKPDKVTARRQTEQALPRRQEPRRQEPKGPPPTQDEINMLIDEEMSLFPEQKKSSNTFEPSVAQADEGTRMQKIQQNRSKWRENPSLNLEESWGSLSQFNKNQRGRLSFDMEDDVLDEYINKAAKMAGLPTEPAIEEEMTEEQDMSIDSDDGFVIPELPYGRELVINIGSTWGDKHYVGFTGLDVFSSTGEQVTITKIHAEPSDINILPEYNKDPRVVDNLIDGSNRTRDDIHMWLAPFTQGNDHVVFATFDKPVKIALIRIWNYNKSRIHSYRGVKDVILALDGQLIFRGEIARACGGTEGGTEAFGDTILFTMDEAILEAVSQNDEAYEGEMLSDDEPFDVERPSTADSGGHGGERPFTRAVGNIKQLEREHTAVSPVPEMEGDIVVYKGKCVELNFTATWGDHHYLGLTGIEVVGKDGDALPVTMAMVTANPRDVRILPGHEMDDRTLEKVIDGMNVTMSDEHMWLIPYNQGQNHTLTVNFPDKVLMAGLRIWNYNKSKEDTYRGARTVHVTIDGKTVSQPDGYLVRKGPGNCHFDYAQEVSFSPEAHKAIALSALGSNTGGGNSDNYEVVQMPCGFIYQFQLFSTWGDVYYVGLNGIELYDNNLKKIPLTETNISAYPDSVNILDKVQNDVRTPDKLIDGVNDTMDGGHMWIAPMLPSTLNRVYVIFDQPTTISMIKIWNYSKTPNRGAKDFALLVDDLLVYNGVLQSIQPTARGILPNCEGPQPYHTVLFTNNKDILRKEKHTIINNPSGEQDVQMTNDKKIVSHYNDPKKASIGKPVDQNKRPTTSVIHSKKRR